MIDGWCFGDLPNATVNVTTALILLLLNVTVVAVPIAVAVIVHKTLVPLIAVAGVIVAVAQLDVKLVVPTLIVNIFLAAVTVSKPVPVNVSTRPVVPQLFNIKPLVLQTPFDVTPLTVGTN